MFSNLLQIPTYVPAFLLLLTTLSCSKIKKKSDQAITATKETVARINEKAHDKKNRLLDKVFPSYDSDKPDTKNNRKRFSEHLQVDPTSDVKNIYAYGDFLGADYKVLIAFTCNQSTIDKIVALKKMQPSTTKDGNGLFFLDEFNWWNKDDLERLTPYIVGKEGDWWEYLWYDPTTKQAYYEEFSL